MADRLLRYLLFNGESDANGRAKSDQSTDIVSDCWSWVSWAIEIGFISNYWKIAKSRKDLEFPKSPCGNSMMSGQTFSNTVNSKNNQTPKRFWVNQHFTIKEIKKFFKDLQVAKDDEKMRVLIEFMSSKSENFKEGSLVGEKEIFSKDFEIKRSGVFGIINKTVNNLIEFADCNTWMPKTIENSFCINSTLAGNPISIQNPNQKYRQSLGIPMGNQIEMNRSRVSQRKSGYEQKIPMSNIKTNDSFEIYDLEDQLLTEPDQLLPVLVGQSENPGVTGSGIWNSRNLTNISTYQKRSSNSTNINGSRLSGVTGNLGSVGHRTSNASNNFRVNSESPTKRGRGMLNSVLAPSLGQRDNISV